MNYLSLLEERYKDELRQSECPPESRYAFLGSTIFDFTTYDGAMDELFGMKAVEVCKAINDKATFEYIEDAENYKWYLIMVNMPFFERKLDWGTSIRGAWWDYGKFEIKFLTDEPLVLDNEQWKLFIAAVIEFARCNSTIVIPEI